MPRFKPRPINFLALLFGAVLALSFGLNLVLLTGGTGALPDVDSDELAVTTADLHLTQRLLAQCQQAHEQQDSLVARLRTSPALLAEQ